MLGQEKQKEVDQRTSNHSAENIALQTLLVYPGLFELAKREGIFSIQNLLEALISTRLGHFFGADKQKDVAHYQVFEPYAEEEIITALIAVHDGRKTVTIQDILDQLPAYRPDLLLVQDRFWLKHEQEAEDEKKQLLADDVVIQKQKEHAFRQLLAEHHEALATRKQETAEAQLDTQWMKKLYESSPDEAQLRRSNYAMALATLSECLVQLKQEMEILDLNGNDFSKPRCKLELGAELSQLPRNLAEANEMIRRTKEQRVQLNSK